MTPTASGLRSRSTNAVMQTLRARTRRRARCLMVLAGIERVRTGATFNTLCGGGDRPDTRNRFVADDLVAVTLLSVEVPPRAAIRILEDDADALSALLTALPIDVPMWEADDSVYAAGSEADQLWSLLAALPGIGWVTVHKLMARKRPEMLPVYDNVVKSVLQPTAHSFWEPLRHELAQDPSLLTRLAEIRTVANVERTSRSCASPKWRCGCANGASCSQGTGRAPRCRSSRLHRVSPEIPAALWYAVTRVVCG